MFFRFLDIRLGGYHGFPIVSLLLIFLEYIFDLESNVMVPLVSMQAIVLALGGDPFLVQFGSFTRVRFQYV